MFLRKSIKQQNGLETIVIGANLLNLVFHIGSFHISEPFQFIQHSTTKRNLVRFRIKNLVLKNN